MARSGRRKRRHPGRSSRRDSGRGKTLADAQATYLDWLHREDSGRSRDWNSAPPPGRRRQGRPDIPATQQRGGERYVRATASDVERVLTGNPDEKLFYITTATGKIVMLKIVRD
jgi:hypothetical protein